MSQSKGVLKYEMGSEFYARKIRCGSAVFCVIDSVFCNQLQHNGVVYHLGDFPCGCVRGVRGGTDFQHEQVTCGMERI